MSVYQSCRRELCAGAKLPTNGWAIVWDAPSFDAAREELRVLVAANSWPYALRPTLADAIRTARALRFPWHTQRPRVLWVGAQP